MNIYLVLFILILTCILFRLRLSKRNRCNSKKINTGVDDDGAGEYIYKGLGFLLKLIYLSIIFTRNSINGNDTMYDILYREFGSPKNKKWKATFIIKFFNLTMVYPKDYNVTKALLCNDHCTNRISKRLAKHYYRGSLNGITFNGGDRGKQLTKFTVKTLGRLGFGKSQTMLTILNEQLSDFIENLENLRKSSGNKIQVHNLFTHAVLNIVWCFAGGEKFAQNDEKLNALHKSFQILSNASLISWLVWSFLPRWTISVFGLGYTKYIRSLDIVNEYISEFVAEKGLRYDEKNPVDFVDYFLLEIDKNQSDPLLNKIYNEDQLVSVLSDLFLGGMDTTAKYMESAFMFLSLNPDAQTTIQEEIDSVIGNCVPSYSSHKIRMPFTQAAIMEIHRMGNVFPLISRVTNKDCIIDGNRYKKGTWILSNFFNFRKDESYWGDPNIFRPQRFLNSENKLTMDRMNHVMPYGVGPRVCLGEMAATSTIFTFLTGILQKYNIVKYNQNELGLAKGFTPICHPEPFHVTLLPR